MLHQSGRILFGSSLTGLLGESTILAQGIPAQVVSVPLLVRLSRSLRFSTISFQSGQFSLLATAIQGLSVFLQSRATAPCSLQSSGSTCRPCPLTLLSVTFLGRSALPRWSASCVLQPGICLGFLYSLTPRRSNPCPVLLFVL